MYAVLTSGRSFNVLPFAFNVADQDPVSFKEAGDVRAKLHWALAGVANADSMQHVDTGGYGTVVHVLSGKKLWAVGSRRDGSAFANKSTCIVRDAGADDWISFDDPEIHWECIMLEAGDML